ncbi:MAG TPA: choice-of-anchor L domain-containing protein [Solirubrobacteraceae bacterium]|nr:choice-of-anchor L domain-containing protein [Solirubrobacteraceae bacterium]
MARALFKHPRVCGAAAALMLLVGLGGVAAAAPNGRITPVSESHAGATMLARAMMANPHELINGRFAAVPPDGHPNAISTEPLAGFPRIGHQYAILTNGCARLADHHRYAGRPGCKDNGIPLRGTRDLTILRLYLKVPHGASCLSFRFRYLSQEFPEFIHSPYNDGFIAELDYTQWNSGFSDPHITAQHDFARDSKGGIVTINSAGPAVMKAAYAKGTTYGGATRVLRASTPITPGRHTLYLSIFDQGDRSYDSAAFIDDLTISHRANCRPGLSATQ